MNIPSQLLELELVSLKYDMCSEDMCFGSGTTICAAIDRSPGVRILFNGLDGTLEERLLGRLFAASPRLLLWAKEACEAVRAQLDPNSFTVPSWLPELEAAVSLALVGPKPPQLNTLTA